MSDTVRCNIKQLLCNDEHDIEEPVRVSANLPVHQQVGSAHAHVTYRILFVFM